VAHYAEKTLLFASLLHSAARGRETADSGYGGDARVLLWRLLPLNASYMRMGWDFLEAPVSAPALPSGVLGFCKRAEVGMIPIY
jgi:hypothetical protein